MQYNRLSKLTNYTMTTTITTINYKKDNIRQKTIEQQTKTAKKEHKEKDTNLEEEMTGGKEEEWENKAKKKKYKTPLQSPTLNNANANTIVTHGNYTS